MLFDKKDRSRTDPKKAGENEFTFYDSSARPAFEVYRSLLNGWIMELPEAERSEMVNRMRKSDSLGYQAALAELTIHAALIRQGYKIELHPKAGHPSRRPDFMVRTAEGASVAIVEVTTFGPAQEQVAQSNREAEIYNAVDRAKLPAGFRLGYDMVEYGKSTPNLAKLLAAIEKWAASNATEDFEEPPTHLFEANDWKIELKLFGGFKKDVVPTRAIGGAFGDVRQVEPRTSIREALQKKGSRYGTFDVPYVVVVADCKGELFGGDHNMDALNEAVFGSIVYEVITFQNDYEAKEVRISNGYWWHGGKPAHENVSATILLPKPHLWELRENRWQPLIMRNQWANHKLPAEFLPLPSYQYLANKDEFAKIEGTRLADILGLPAVWPPDEN